MKKSRISTGTLIIFYFVVGEREFRAKPKVIRLLGKKIRLNVKYLTDKWIIYSKSHCLFTHSLNDINQKLRRKNCKSIHFTSVFQNSAISSKLCLQFFKWAIFDACFFLLWSVLLIIFFFALVNFIHFCWTGKTYVIRNSFIISFEILQKINLDSVLPIDGNI